MKTVRAYMLAVVVCLAEAFGGSPWDVSDVLRQAFPPSRVSQTPAQNTSYKIHTFDGVGLETNVKLPYPYDAKRPAVLCRTPYGPLDFSVVDVFVEYLGFASVIQQMRGTFESGGVFDLWRADGEDASQTINWIANQPWSNGEVYTVGFSADGIGEVLDAIRNPLSSLRGQWWSWTPANGHGFIYPGGAYRQDLSHGYMKLMAAPTRGASWLRVIGEVERHEADSEWWDPVTLCRNMSASDCHYRNVAWPVVSWAAWWDVFSQNQIDAFEGLRAMSTQHVRDEHVLIVSPLGHCSLAKGAPEPLFAYHGDANAQTVAAELSLEKFQGIRHGPVRARIGRYNFYVAGSYDRPAAANFWTSLEEWPAAEHRHLYLREGAVLARQPAQQIGQAEYVYDPRDPTPMLGGNNLPGAGAIEVCGPAEQLAREQRPDVAVFDSEPLSTELPVVGRIRAKLFVSSSAEDTDFVVMLSDLSPEGDSSMLVRFGAKRMRWRDSPSMTVGSDALVPGNVYEIDVDLDATAFIFGEGHRVRVTVASAASPFFDANHNTGKFKGLAPQVWKTVVARNAVHFAPKYPSSVSLPVVSRDAIPQNAHFWPTAQLSDVVVV